jgi:hypothetical protein
MSVQGLLIEESCFCKVVGPFVGLGNFVGLSVGELVGLLVGDLVALVGLIVGDLVGFRVG